MTEPRRINPGDKFGEEDLKVGMTRRSNVVSKSAVDLLYLHKFVSLLRIHKSRIPSSISEFSTLLSRTDELGLALFLFWCVIFISW